MLIALRCRGALTLTLVLVKGKFMAPGIVVISYPLDSHFRTLGSGILPEEGYVKMVLGLNVNVSGDVIKL